MGESRESLATIARQEQLQLQLQQQQQQQHLLLYSRRGQHRVELCEKCIKISCDSEMQCKQIATNNTPLPLPSSPLLHSLPSLLDSSFLIKNRPHHQCQRLQRGQSCRSNSSCSCVLSCCCCCCFLQLLLLLAVWHLLQQFPMN